MTLDFKKPKDNVYAFAKMWSTLDSKPVLSNFHGTMFAYVPGKRLLPLFGYAGIGNFQAKILDNGHAKLRGKETGYFTDLNTGEVISHWDNPWTGETVEVFNFLNDRVRGEISLKMPVFDFGDEDDEPTLMNASSASADAPFILPWQRFGDKVLLEWDYAHCYRNPVTADKWPKASTGPVINPSEHFTFDTSYQQLADQDNPSALYSAGFSRLSPWWPWMKMGKSARDGVLFGRMFSIKGAGGINDIPRPILDYTVKHHPDYLEPCQDWDNGGPIGTWEAYARQVKPEII